MPTLQDTAHREELGRRIAGLDPDRKPLWGKMNAHQMLCHVGDQMRVALGDIRVKDRSNFLMRSLAKWLVIYLDLPEPKGKIETAPEMLTTKPSDWEADRASLIELMDRVAAAEQVAPHPMFAKLSHKEWSVLAAKHVDYHLRQFAA